MRVAKGGHGAAAAVQQKNPHRWGAGNVGTDQSDT